MKNKFLFISIFILVILVFLTPIEINGFSFWMDNNGLLDSKNSIINYIYGWKLDLFGIVNFTSYTSMFHYIFSYTFLNIFGYEYGYYTMYFSIICIILFLGYKLSNIYIKDQLSALLVATIFIFNLPFIRFFYGQGTFTFIIAVVGLLSSLVILLKGNFQKNNNILIILAIFGCTISHPFLFFFYYIIIVSLLFFYKNIGFKKIILYSILLFLMNFFWIFQFFLGNVINYSLFLQSDYSNSLVNVFSANSQLFNSLIFLGKNSDYINSFFGITGIFIIIIYMILWLIVFKILLKGKLNRLSIIILSLILFLLVFSVGAREPLGMLYSYLYNNISLFSFFRTFSNVLLFCFYLFILFIIVNIKKDDYKYIIYLNIIFIIMFTFSVKYYGYNKTSHMPNDYFDVKNIIDSSVSGKNIAILPCSIYDYYTWDDGSQDKYFFENFFANNGVIFYRPTLSNNYILKNLFDQICNYDIDLQKLKNYNIDYILLRKDLLYSHLGYFNEYDESHLSNLEKIYSGEYLSLYKINGNSLDNFSQISPIHKEIKLHIGKQIKNVFFLNNFNPNWKLYLKNQQGIFSKPLFENTHHLVYDYANGWNISKDEIIKYVDENYSKELQKEGYPKQIANGKLDYKYYVLNSDGSIDVELTLYFKPQSYFYLGLIISGTTFIILVGYLTISYIRNRKEEIISEID